jgi:hypothetical protein
MLVACRGVPIVGAGGCSLGPLPEVASIPVRMSGSGTVDKTSPAYQTRVMQIVSSTGLTNFYARCDRAAGGKTPIMFESAVRAFAMPRVRDDGSLATVAIVNASIDRQEPVTVCLRGVPAEIGAQSADRGDGEAFQDGPNLDKGAAEDALKRFHGIRQLPQQRRTGEQDHNSRRRAGQQGKLRVCTPYQQDGYRAENGKRRAFYKKLHPTVRTAP